MTEAKLEHIQAVCRGWLRQSDTSTDSRMTIPAGGALSRTIEIKISALLTFDNVLIMSAVDAETGACYTKLIGRQGEPGELIDTPLDQISFNSTSPASGEPAPLRATQKRYQDAMERFAQVNSINKGVAPVSDTNELWIEKTNSEVEQVPKYLLYTGEKLLGYSLLERARSNGERSGRFHPSEEYFEYAQIFAALPLAENDCLEANCQEGYGIFERENDGYRARFALLSAQVDALELYVEEEGGHRIEASEIRLEDLSHDYDDETERWLYVTYQQNSLNDFRSRESTLDHAPTRLRFQVFYLLRSRRVLSALCCRPLKRAEKTNES